MKFKPLIRLTRWPQESREQALESQLVAARWSSLQGAVEEAERIIQDSLAQIDDPAHISCTSSAGQTLRIELRAGTLLISPFNVCLCYFSADYLASRCQASLDCMQRLQCARNNFLTDNTGETHTSEYIP